MPRPSPVEPGDVFEKVRLAGAVEVHIGRGVRVVEAEVLVLPRVVDPVAGIAAEVVGVHVQHGE